MQYQNLLSHLLLSLSPAAFANHFLTMLFYFILSFLALLKSSNKYREGVGGGEEEKKQAAHGRAETLAQGP